MRRLLLLLCALASCAKPPASSGLDGKTLYSQTCARCHGKEGHGDTPEGRQAGAKDLTRDEVRRMPDVEIGHQIRMGRGKMPGFGGQLGDRDIEALVQYVRTLALPH